MNDSLGAPASLLRAVPRSSTLIDLAARRRPIAVVVGPPHSGLSVCAYALSLLGVEMTEADAAHPAAGPDASSWHGIWERQPVRQFHDQILALFDRAAFGPLYDFALPVAWWADPRVVPIRREIAAILEDRIDAGRFGFADPRTMRLLPLWLQIFTELKLSPKIVLCLRDPTLASRSLHDRDGIDPALAEYRWFVHMTDFFRYADRLDYCVVEYENWFDDGAANLDKLQKFLDLEWRQGEVDRELVLASIAALAGPAAEGRGPDRRQPIVRAFYELARRPVDGAGDLGRREQIVQQFVAFQQLQKPIERALAANAAAVAEVARERDRHVEACAALGAELASARSSLAERDAALGRALGDAAAARSERQTAGAALAKSEAAREALRALVAVSRQELEKTQLAGAEREEALRSAQARLAAVESAQRIEIEGLRDVARRAEQDGAALRDRLAQIEQEDAALRTALTAARQVAKAAMQALAAAAIPATPADRLGWFGALKRRLGFGVP